MAKDEAYAKVIQEAFQGRAMPTIRAITYDVVNSIWSLDMPGNRSDETVALQVARQIHNLAQCLAAMLELRDFDLDFIASGGVTTLAQKIRTGRLLVRERVPVDDSVPLSPEHIIDANQMETGTSGSLPSIEGPTYQCKTSNLREILRVLGRPKKKSKDSKGAKGAKGAKDSEHDSKDAGHDS